MIAVSDGGNFSNKARIEQVSKKMNKKMNSQGKADYLLQVARNAQIKRGLMCDEQIFIKALDEVSTLVDDFSEITGDFDKWFHVSYEFENECGLSVSPFDESCLHFIGVNVYADEEEETDKPKIVIAAYGYNSELPYDDFEIDTGYCLGYAVLDFANL